MRRIRASRHPNNFKTTYVDTGIAPSAKVYTTMSNTIDSDTTTAKEYRWKGDGTDGLRSYSYASSNPAWNYSTEPDSSNVINSPGADDDGAYLFSDSSIGQPFARRGNLYNWTAATLGSSLKLTDADHAPDSICPRGWQLPVGGFGSTDKSFEELLSTYNLLNNNDVNDANELKEWPLQYLPTGGYYYNYGYVNLRTTDGFWWSKVAVSDSGGYNLSVWGHGFNAQDDYGSGYGFALRK